MVFDIEIARRVIRIHSLYDEVYYLCKGYLCEGSEPALTITTTMQDLNHEKQMAEKIYGEKFVGGYGYLETLSVYRKIAAGLLSFDVLLLHGAAISIMGASYLLTAPSGAGKTTCMRYLLSNCDEAFVINGDKPLLCNENDVVMTCGTPWSGKEHLNRNCRIPLRAICLLDRGEDTAIEEIRFSDAMPVLLQQVFKPDSSIGIIKTLELLKILSRDVRFYRFTLKYYADVREIDGARVAELFMSKVVN